MNWAEAVVLIVIITAVARTLRTTIVMRGQGEKHITFNRKGNPTEIRSIDTGRDNAGPGAQEAALAREVAELRERIKVLERIATDGRAGRELADEIEKLR